MRTSTLADELMSWALATVLVTVPKTIFGKDFIKFGAAELAGMWDSRVCASPVHLAHAIKEYGSKLLKKTYKWELEKCNGTVVLAPAFCDRSEVTGHSFKVRWVSDHSLFTGVGEDIAKVLQNIKTVQNEILSSLDFRHSVFVSAPVDMFTAPASSGVKRKFREQPFLGWGRGKRVEVSDSIIDFVQKELNQRPEDMSLILSEAVRRSRARPDLPKQEEDDESYEPESEEVTSPELEQALKKAKRENYYERWTSGQRGAIIVSVFYLYF